MSYDIPSCVLLHLDGAPASTNFPDTGVYKTSFVGYSAAISNSQTLFGGSNVLGLNGTTGHLLSTKTDSLMNGDFTLEAWVYLLSLPTSTSTWPTDVANHTTIISLTSNNWNDCGLIINSTDIFFADNAVSVNTHARGAHGLTTGSWNHLACSRSGGVINTYVNGNIVGTSNISVILTDTQSINIGAGHHNVYSLTTGTAFLHGYMSEVRFIKGYGVYTVAFTPSSSVRFTDFGLSVEMLPISYTSQSIGSQGAGTTNNRILSSVPFGKNIYQGGSGIIIGQTIENSAPVSRRVRLFNKRNGLLVKEVFSDNLGVYTFDYIDKRQEYFIMADDYRRIRNAVVVDGVTPIPAPYTDPNSDV